MKKVICLLTSLIISPCTIVFAGTPQIGMDKIKKYLSGFFYGNQDMSE
jgi:hypothetical protein